MMIILNHNDHITQTANCKHHFWLSSSMINTVARLWYSRMAARACQHGWQHSNGTRTETFALKRLGY